MPHYDRGMSSLTPRVLYEKIAEVCRVFIEAIFHKLPAMPYEIRWMAKILLRYAGAQQRVKKPLIRLRVFVSSFFLRLRSYISVFVLCFVFALQDGTPAETSRAARASADAAGTFRSFSDH
jgi:hypothetical protein